MKTVIKKFRQRRNNRLLKRIRQAMPEFRFDDEEERAERDSGNKGGKFGFVYGLCAQQGIDTTGMGVQECFEALKGKGIDGNKAIEAINKTGSVAKATENLNKSKEASETQNNSNSTNARALYKKFSHNEAVRRLDYLQKREDKFWQYDKKQQTSILKDITTSEQYDLMVGMINGGRGYDCLKESTNFVRDSLYHEKLSQAYETGNISSNSTIIGDSGKSQFDERTAMISNTKLNGQLFLREQSAEVWTQLSKEEQTHVWAYTANEGNTHVGQQSENDKTRLNYLHTAISKSEIKQDIIVSRGVSYATMKRIFGSEAPEVDACGQDKGVCSTTTAKRTEWKDVSLVMRVKKGSHGLYAEPFSKYGDGGGLSWNGKTEPEKIGEGELILRDNYQLTIIKKFQVESGKKKRWIYVCDHDEL